MDFTGRKILVTGAGKGIGEGLTRALVSYGAHVVAVSRTAADLEKLSEDLNEKVTCITLDIGDWDRVESALTDDVLEGVDGLVNNAAIARCEPFFQSSKKDFDDMFNINVKALMHISQIVTKKMIAQGKTGAVVNLSSQASQAALENHTIYCASKAAVDQITRVMALELGPHKVLYEISE